MRGLLVLIFLLAPFYTVEAQRSNGIGKSLQDAVVNGLFNIVNAETGGAINRDDFQNTESVFNALTNMAAGLITDLDILNKNQTTAGNWEVSIDASLDNSIFETDDVTQLVKKKIARWDKIQSGLFRNRSVLVVYDDRDLTEALMPDSPEVLAIMDQIENQLASLHFDVIVSSHNLATLKREKPVAEIADAVVIATLQKAVESYELRDGVKYIQVTAHLKAYDTHTNRVLANFPQRKKDLVKGNSNIISDAVSRIAAKAGKAAAQELARTIVLNYRAEGVPILVNISDISEDQMDVLIDGLETASISYKVERYTKNILQIKLITEIDTLAIRRLIRKIAKSNKFELKTIQQQGDSLKMEVASK